jgi:hypothetical protein
MYFGVRIQAFYGCWNQHSDRLEFKLGLTYVFIYNMYSGMIFCGCFLV